MNLDTLVECLVIAEKYEIQSTISQLRDALSSGVNDPLRVYAIASRFGFTNIAEATFRNILSSVNLTGTPQLPDDFEFIPATRYHELIRQRAHYLGAIVEVIRKTQFQLPCSGCRGGRFTEEVFRLRLAHLIMKGTPVEVPACLGAWMKVYESNAECEDDCVPKFIRAAISRVNKWLVNLGEPSPKRKSTLKKA